MMGHVFRHARNRNRRWVAVRPLAGLPRDAEGRLIVEYVYDDRPVAEPLF